MISVVGARPQFVKLAPLSSAFVEARIDHVIVHTGQHYDTNMSEVFFADLRIPTPDINLRIGSGSHGVQTGAMLAALDPVLDDMKPDWVLVYGDTNSTLAGALSAVKQHLPLAHLEAGLRSFNRLMPEEHNRVLTDHAADLLLAPTQTAMRNLADEGLGAQSILVGDVMADLCLRLAATQSDDLPLLEELGVTRKGYALATIHRAENTDDPARLAAIVDALMDLPLPVVLLAHPRVRQRVESAGIRLDGGSLKSLEPQPYPQTMQLMSNSRAVITDSGGLQKEAYVLAVPCITIRAETEWIETLVGGWNQLCPDPRGLGGVIANEPKGRPNAVFGGGHASQAVVNALGGSVGDKCPNP